MTTFDRRTFLGSVFATAGFAAAPEWLARAMAPQDPAVTDRLPRLREAVQRAQANGKPVLVFVVPEDRQNEGAARSQWLGAWLSQGGPAALHAVALGEVVAASLAEVKEVTGAVVEGVPYFVLLDVSRVGEPGAPPPKTTAVQVAIEPMWTFERIGVDAAGVEAVKRKALAGYEKISMALQDGLNRHGATVATVAAATLAKLDGAQKERLARWIATGRDDDDELVVRAAAEVRRAAAELDDPERTRVLAGLTVAIEKVVVHRRVQGSRWQVRGGCGVCYEDQAAEEGAMIRACGMGMVSLVCERFLDFWAPGI